MFLNKVINTKWKHDYFAQMYDLEKLRQEGEKEL